MKWPQDEPTVAVSLEARAQSAGLSVPVGEILPRKVSAEGPIPWLRQARRPCDRLAGDCLHRNGLRFPRADYLHRGHVRRR
jgi:hypothetical protein